MTDTSNLDQEIEEAIDKHLLEGAMNRADTRGYLAADILFIATDHVGMFETLVFSRDDLIFSTFDNTDRYARDPQARKKIEESFSDSFRERMLEDYEGDDVDQYHRFLDALMADPRAFVQDLRTIKTLDDRLPFLEKYAKKHGFSPSVLEGSSLFKEAQENAMPVYDDGAIVAKAGEAARNDSVAETGNLVHDGAARQVSRGDSFEHDLVLNEFLFQVFEDQQDDYIYTKWSRDPQFRVAVDEGVADLLQDRGVDGALSAVQDKEARDGLITSWGALADNLVSSPALIEEQARQGAVHAHLIEAQSVKLAGGQTVDALYDVFDRAIHCKPDAPQSDVAADNGGYVAGTENAISVLKR